MSQKTYREHSRGEWVTQDGSNPGVEQLQLGALQRIADASELMAKDRLQMERDLKYYKDGYADRGARNTRLERRVAALRGVITKLKKK